MATPDQEVIDTIKNKLGFARDVLRVAKVLSLHLSWGVM